MASLVVWLNSVSAAWWGVMLAVIWQSTLLIVFASAAVVLILRRVSPAYRFWLCQAVAVKLLIMPFWISTFPLPWFLRGTQATTGASAVTQQTERLQRSRPPVGGEAKALRRNEISGRPVSVVQHGSPQQSVSAPSGALGVTPPVRARLTRPAWLLVAWLAGVCLLTLRLTVQRHRLGLLLSRAQHCEEGELPGLLRSACERLDVRSIPRLLWCQFNWSPFVCGLRTPSLVLPRALQGQLTQSQWLQVLLHETAHVKRRDLLWNWVPTVASTVYFFHPAVHWLARRICLERELACDAMSMAAAGASAADYADTLLCVLTQTSDAGLSAAGSSRNR